MFLHARDFEAEEGKDHIALVEHGNGRLVERRRAIDDDELVVPTEALEHGALQRAG